MDSNRSKRFDFLLKQTEIFSHFMPGSSNKITPEKKKSGRKKEKKAAPVEAVNELDDKEIDPAE
jgi:SWI/SNF-related matrix-associated actin-dependent regulator of chromatin subfamily A member 5